MGYFDDIVCELHALEWHGLPLHTCAGTVNKSLLRGQEAFKYQVIEGRTDMDQYNILQKDSPDFGR